MPRKEWPGEDPSLNDALQDCSQGEDADQHPEQDALDHGAEAHFFQNIGPQPRPDKKQRDHEALAGHGGDGVPFRLESGDQGTDRRGGDESQDEERKDRLPLRLT